MRVWQLRQAKARLSELVRTCLKNGPQVISVRGKEEAVLISKKEYDRLTKKRHSLIDLIDRSPFKGLELEVKRDMSMARDAKV